MVIVMRPLRGQWGWVVWGCAHNVGAAPTLIYIPPSGVVHALKGQYIIAQGLGPGDTVSIPIQVVHFIPIQVVPIGALQWYRFADIIK